MAKTSLRNYNREIESMLERNQLDEVVAHCLHILKIYPKHLETYRLLGKAYLEKKQRGDAADIFSRILVCVPNDFVAHVGMSILRDEENKLDDAIWHMERAFESQPSNAAVQSELQRLYGQRDGTPPPRIRMTRGALAQMYIKGELYPQAISEIKSVLAEDPGRADMQALLARAHYRSGQKNEAAEAAGSLLRRYPYCLDANIVLVEILGTDRPENMQVYRQRVVELDPYAAHVTGSLFNADAPDSAIAIERFDLSSQPVSMAADWRERQGISLESGQTAQPDWLTSELARSEIPPPTQPQPGSAFDFSAPSQTDSSPAGEELPDFLRDAGWGKSTGAFDESKPVFAGDETLPPTASADLAAGDLPDWIKEMQPAESMQPAEEIEPTPDWLNKIDTGILGSPLETPASTDQPDWLNPPAQPGEPTLLPSSDQPDWLKEMGSEAPQQPTAKMEADSPGETEQEKDDAFAWLEGLAAKQGATEGLLVKPEDRLEEVPDWVKQARSLSGEDSELPAAPSMPMEATPAQPVGGFEDLGKSEQEQDDSFAWLEGLAAKQGATEGLLVRPEDRLEQEPDWVKQAKVIGEEESLAQPASQQPEPAMDTATWLRSLDQEEPSTEPATESAGDDTSIWLKGLDEAEAKPEPLAEPARDDTAMWLKSLDETDAKPEPVTESADVTAMWLKNLDEPEPVPLAKGSDDLPAWMQSIEEEKTDSGTGSIVPAAEAEVSSDEPVLSEGPKMDTGSLPSWLRGLDQEGVEESAKDDLPAWLRDETGEVVAEPVKIEPTRAADWQPMDAAEPESYVAPEEKPQPAPKPKKPAARKSEARPATPVAPYQEPVTRKGTGMLTPTVDMILGQARNELSRSNIPGALETYAKLIKRGRFLDEVIFDLREALYRYPVEVSIWQSLGDAYMRANRLQDALDAYTKAEELLR